MLWDTLRVILIYDNPRANETYQKTLAKIKRWIARVGSRPLTVKIEKHEYYAKDGNLLLKELLVLILQSALEKMLKHVKYNSCLLAISLLRIKTCTWNDMTAATVIEDLKQMGSIIDYRINNPVIAISPDLQSSLGTPTLLQLPFLTKLSLRNLDIFSIGYILPALELPAFQHFAFSHIDNKESLPNGSVVWYILLLFQRSNSSDVECLDLDFSLQSFNQDELLEVFRLVPSLKHFKFTLKLWSNSPESYINRSQPIDFIHLNSLSTFHINIRTLPFAGDAAPLHYLALPALKKFQVILPKTRSSRPHFTDLEDLVEQSNCKLKTLNINTTVNIPKLHLLTCYKSYRLWNAYIFLAYNGQLFQLTDTLFELLLPECQCSDCGHNSGEEMSEVYLPNLSEVFPEGILAPKIKWDYILDAFEYRWKGDEGSGVKKLSRAERECGTSRACEFSSGERNGC
ncbi:hypothetical protein BDQ17DRAFT_1413513 [Cyathus striatus]|nr:hypothetical protein BDQ17DRAFT_1413513 [Cyathus striatus]